MSNLLKKIVASAMTITCAVWLMGPGVAQALTAAELQTQIDTLLAQIATLQTQLTALTGAAAGAPAACSGITFSRSLAQGMSGTDVKCLQAILNQSTDTQVAASGVGSPGSETTYFGSLTKAAVVKFQVKYAADILTPIGLTAGTGFVGAKTIVKLNSVLTAGGVVTPTTPTVTLPTAEGLTVELAADNPAATSIIADSSNTAGSQALIPYLKVKFSTPAGTSAKVTTLKVKRLGISSDTDISNAYLYDGGTKLAEMTSLSSGIMIFTNSAGLFTVSGVKTITVKADLYKDATAGKTIGMGIDAVASITTDAATVNGTFPMNGNLMTVAAVADFGRLTAATTTNSGTVDPGTTYAAMGFSLASGNQKITIYSIKFQQIGSIQFSDVANLALWVGSTQLGSTVAALSSDGTVTFDLSSSPYTIDSGMTRNISLRVDVIGGSTRTIQFSLQRSADIVAKDANYDVYLAPDTTTGGIAVWTVLDSTPCTVNAGNLVISKRTDSPSGNVALNGTNVTIAKFDVRAFGESIKVNSVSFVVASTSDWGYINNVKLYFDSLQRGITTQYQSATVTAMATNFTVPVGEIKILEIKADIKGGGGGTGFIAGDTLQGKVDIGISNAQRLTSLGSFNFPSAVIAGNALTVTSGLLTGTKNGAVGDTQTVYNVQGVRLGSFYMTAGSAEGVDVTKISFRSSTSTATGTDASYSLGAGFTNLTLYSGSTQLGSIVVPNTTDIASTEYNFYPIGFSIAKGTSAVIDLKADVSSVPGWVNGDVVTLISAEGTGQITTTAADFSAGVLGQSIVLTGAGVLTLGIDSSTPDAAIVAMSQTDKTLGIWKLSASNIEDLTVSSIAALSDGLATSSNSVQNLRLYCGTEQFGSAASGLVLSGGTYYASFVGSCVIPKGSYKLVSLKADIVAYAAGPYGAGTYNTNANDFVKMYLEVPMPVISDSFMVVRGAGDYASTTIAASSSASNAYVYRTSLAASIACQGVCTGAQRGRAAIDKIASLTLSGTASADAQFRTSVTADDEGDLAYWAVSEAGSTIATNTGQKVDGNASNLYTVAGVAATDTWAVVDMKEALGGKTIVDYSKISLWLYPDASTTASGAIYLIYTDTTSSEALAEDALTNALASSSIATSSLTAGAWNFVEATIPTGISTTTCVGLAIATQGTESTGMLTYIDNLRLYNESINIDLSGNTTDTASGTPFYLKSGATEKAMGAYDAASGKKVTLIPSSEISVGSTGVTYDLITDTTRVVDIDTTAVETLGLSLDLGDIVTAGDFRWYDQAVAATSSITWLNGASPISVSLSY